MDYDNYFEYDLQTYLTVFWEFNRNRNNFIPKLLKHAKIINEIDLNLITYENTAHNNEIIKQIDDFYNVINKIKGLKNALDCVLTPMNINKINQYELDYLSKVDKIQQQIVESIPSLNNKEFTESFVEFMYNNTPEGRIAYQNKKALEIINEINNAILLDKKIKAIIYTVPDKKNEIIIDEKLQTELNAITIDTDIDDTSSMIVNV